MAIKVGDVRMTKTEFLAQWGIDVANIRWSWTGQNRDGDLVLFVWKDKIVPDGEEKWWVEILNAESATRQGGKERRRMLEAKGEHQGVRLVVQDRPDDPGKGPSKTTAIDPTLYTGGKQRKDADGTRWIQVTDYQP